MAAQLMPLACMHLGRAFSTHVFCSDASPGGHGYCYGTAPASDVRACCRMAESRRDYSQLATEDAEFAPPPDGLQPARVPLPLETMWWHRVGRPGCWQRINLEEAKALRWPVTQRAKMLGETNARCLHTVDNASCVGATAKGRSSSWALDGELENYARLLLHASLAGGIDAAYVALPRDLCRRRAK